MNITRNYVTKSIQGADKSVLWLEEECIYMTSRIIYELDELMYSLTYDWAHFPTYIDPISVAGVAPTKDGRIFALIRNHKYPIVEFDQEGNFIGSYGRELNFKSGHGLFITDDDRMWVCDSGRHVVYQLTLEGEVISMLGTLDKPCDNGFEKQRPFPHNLFTIKFAGKPFNLPTGAIQAPNGDVFCCDGYGNTSIHHFTQDGKHVKTWGGPGEEPGKFRLPHSIWMDPKQNLWVADRENFRVQVFSTDGELVKCFDNIYPKGSDYGQSYIWGDDELIYVGQNSIGIYIYNLDYEIKGVIEAPINSPILGHSLCVDGTGSIFVGHLDMPYHISKLERIYK